MDKIILLPGMASSNFFTSEIPYIKERFEVIGVIAYKEANDRVVEEIARKHQLPVTQIGGSFLRVIMTGRFWKILFSRESRREFGRIVKMRGRLLRRLAYMLYYQLFCAEACGMIDEMLAGVGEGEKVVLYSFWLSRGAHAVSHYRKYGSGKDKVKKALSRAHGYDLYEERNGAGYLPFREEINDGLDAIYFISEDGRRYFCEKYAFSKRGAEKLVARLGTSNGDGIAKAVVPKESVCIVSCSSVISVKRLDLVIGLVARLCGSLGGRVRWVHIGDGKMMGEMARLAGEMLPEGCYSFLGRVENGRILSEYERMDADYFVNLSDSEGVPVSIMEAMSFGIPCIGRRVGGVPEIIDDSCGLLVEDADGEYGAILEFVRMRLEDGEGYKELSDGARRKWEEEYNAERNYGEFFDGIKVQECQG